MIFLVQFGINKHCLLIVANTTKLKKFTCAYLFQIALETMCLPVLNHQCRFRTLQCTCLHWIFQFSHAMRFSANRASCSPQICQNTGNYSFLIVHTMNTYFVKVCRVHVLRCICASDLFFGFMHYTHEHCHRSMNWIGLSKLTLRHSDETRKMCTPLAMAVKIVLLLAAILFT